MDIQSDFLIKGRLVKRFRLPASTLLSFYDMDSTYFSIMTNSISSKIFKQEETSKEKMAVIAEIYKESEIIG